MSTLEKRFAPRKNQTVRGLLGGVTIAGRIECLLRDISTTGARLELPFDLSPYAIIWPPKIKLVLPIDRLEVDCALVRRRNREFGVKFCSPFRSMAQQSLAA